MFYLELNNGARARLILATNEMFMLRDHIGPGHDLGAKIWKTKAGAKRYAEKRWGTADRVIVTEA